MCAPLGFAFGEREMCHEVVGRGAVPVPFAGWGDDDVAGSDAQEWSATRLDEAFAFGDAESLSEGVAVPCGGGAWGGGDPAGGHGGGALSLGGRGGGDVAGGPVGGFFLGGVFVGGVPQRSPFMVG